MAKEKISTELEKLREILEKYRIEEHKKRGIIGELIQINKERYNKPLKVKLTGIIVKKYLDAYLNVIEEYKILEKRNKTANSKILKKLILKILEEEDQQYKKIIQENKIFNLTNFIEFLISNDIESKRIILIFEKYISHFKELLKGLITHKDAVNTRVPQDIRNDFLSILYIEYSVVKNLINMKHKDKWKNFEEKVLKLKKGNILTKLFLHFYEKGDLKPTQLAVLMLLYNNRKSDGSTILPQEEAAKRLNVSRQTISSALKELKNKGYIREDKNFRYKYKNKLAKVYYINWDKLIDSL